MLQSYKKIWLDAFDFKGRMPRGVYLRALLVQILLVTIPSWLAILLLSDENEVLGYVGLFGLSFSFVPMLSATVRRLHDIGRSGKWILFYPLTSFWIIGIVMFLIHVTDPSDGDNRWGAGSLRDKGMELCHEGQHEKSRQNKLEEASFVDERLTEQDIRNDRRKLWGVLLKLFAIHVIFGLVGYVLKELSWYLFYANY